MLPARVKTAQATANNLARIGRTSQSTVQIDSVQKQFEHTVLNHQTNFYPSRSWRALVPLAQDTRILLLLQE